MPQPSVVDPFEGVDWEDLHKRLLAVAVRLSMLISRSDKVLTGTGVSAEDLVNDTIVKALGGDEIRYHANRGQLFGLLKTAMVRDFLDMRKSSGHRRAVAADFVSDEAERDARLRDRRLDERQDAASLIGDVKRLVRDDPSLLEYMEAVELGCEKPAEIAGVCQVDVKEIYVRRRRLKAKLAGYLEGRTST